MNEFYAASHDFCPGAEEAPPEDRNGEAAQGCLVGVDPGVHRDLEGAVEGSPGESEGEGGYGPVYLGQIHCGQTGSLEEGIL